MSRPGSDPEPGVYDALLVIAVAALLAGVGLLWVQLGAYDYVTAG